MFKFGWKIERTFLSKRNHRKVLNQCNREAMERVRDRFMKIKFTQSAFYEYPGVYERRRESYVRRKIRRVGHNRPLVLSGQMQRYTQSNSIVRATYKGGSLTIRNYFRMREQMRNELEALSRRQKARLAQFIERRYVQLSKDRRFLTRKTVRSS